MVVGARPNRVLAAGRRLLLRHPLAGDRQAALREQADEQRGRDDAGGAAATEQRDRDAEEADVAAEAVLVAVLLAEDEVGRGERPVQEIEGRVYQQMEIEAGPFRRVVELNADVVPEEAKATYDDGILRVELPLRPTRAASRRVPIDP